MEKKLDALAIMESQFTEGGANGYPELMPSDPEKQKSGGRKSAMVLPRRNPGHRHAFPGQTQ